MKKRRLTPKQQAFCDFYIETGNATEAAIKAGYSKRTARVIGQENLLKPALKKYIDERMGEIASNRIVNATEALEILSSIIRGEMVEEVVTVTGEIVKRRPDATQRRQAIDSLFRRYLQEAQIKKLEREIKEEVAESGVTIIEDIPDIGDD